VIGDINRIRNANGIFFYVQIKSRISDPAWLNDLIVNRMKAANKSLGMAMMVLSKVSKSVQK